MDSLQDSTKAEAGSESDSEPEAGDQLRMTFLGDTKKRGKAVLAPAAEDAQVHLLPAAEAGFYADVLGFRQQAMLVHLSQALSQQSRLCHHASRVLACY